MPAISSGIFGFPKDRCAKILLEESRSFLTSNDISIKPEAEGLIYNTDISVLLQGPFNHDQHMHISRKKKDLLWYYKGPELITNGLLQNFIPSERPEKELYEWKQSTKEAEAIISKLTFPDTGDVVLDLMMGTGTNIKAALNCGAGRKAIGIEIIQDICELAKTYILGSFRDAN